MVHDELWFLTEMDRQDDLIAQLTREEADEDRDYEYELPWQPRLRPFLVTESPAFPEMWYFATRQPTPVRKVRNGQPQLTRRQIHACRFGRNHRAMRDYKIVSKLDRQLVALRDCDRDLADQLNDYLADCVTDVPSVGVTSYISYFGRNVGEYPLVEYERGDFADDYEEDEEFEPAWVRYGFISEAEYEDYLDAYGSLYADDWDDPSYYDKYLGEELETA